MTDKKYFGTDGVRGTVGKDPMTADFALKLGSAAAQVIIPDGGKVIIGKDTRVSGYMFESALEAGFVAAGANVLLTGPLPTPGIAFLCQEINADLGVVISASHNHYFDNGIKFFDSSGEKLTDKIELEIERYLDQPAITKESKKIGHAKIYNAARERYQEFCVSSFPVERNLEKYKIVFDGANGAAYKIAPRIFSQLGANVIPIGCSPNGRNINHNCGSTQPLLLQQTVVATKSEIGIAVDGDGDRLLLIDDSGEILDGDQILFILAKALKKSGELTGPVVGTNMSNMGLEVALNRENIDFLRADVGDRNVFEMLKKSGGMIGGEASGHVICLNKTTTGDGIVTALQVLAVMEKTGKNLSELYAGMQKYPQKIINVKVKQNFSPLGSSSLKKLIDQIKNKLGNDGRVVLRNSGTEPIFRIMVEGKDEETVNNLAKQLESEVRSVSE